MKKILIGLIGIFCFVGANAQVPEQAVICIACHGEKGISSNDLWPNLAAQQRDYLVKEMRAFRDGTRVDLSKPSALLKDLGDAQILELANYFSELKQAKPDPVESGAPGANVRAYCVACHGMDGITVTSIWPNLSAQKEGYLKKQLLDYKSGNRKHPIMNVIASELTEEQLAAVAKYYSQH